MIDGSTIVALAMIFGTVAIIFSGSKSGFRAKFRGLEIETIPASEEQQALPPGTEA